MKTQETNLRYFRICLGTNVCGGIAIDSLGRIVRYAPIFKRWKGKRIKDMQKYYLDRQYLFEYQKLEKGGTS